MANITAGDVLNMVDGLVPNQYETATKLRWLAQAEGIVRREVCRDASELPSLEEATVLTVPDPYDELYRFYVEAQIHYANGEMVRYNNAAAAWNGALITYRDYRCRSTPPTRGSVLKLC